MNIFDRYPKKYDIWYERNKFAYLSEIKALKRVIPKEGRGLEIGVGTGRFASALGIRMGIDPSHNMIKLAEERGVNVRWGFGEDLPFGDNAFDYVAIIVTLSFVDSPPEVLKEAWRVMKNKAKLIIAIIDKNSFLGTFYKQKKDTFYKQADLFTVKKLTDLLKIAGFDKFIYYQTIFKLPNKIDSIEKPKRGFGKGGFVVVKARKVKEN